VRYTVILVITLTLLLTLKYETLSTLNVKYTLDGNGWLTKGSWTKITFYKFSQNSLEIN